jgi:hypothetical protein
LKRLEQELRPSGMYVRRMADGDGKWEGRIDYHYRVTFELEGNVIQLCEVGTHTIF